MLRCTINGIVCLPWLRIESSPILKQLFPLKIVANMLSTANYAVLHIVVLGENISLMLHLD